jgi:hypothetical protein
MMKLLDEKPDLYLDEIALELQLFRLYKAKRQKCAQKLSIFMHAISFSILHVSL